MRVANESSTPQEEEKPAPRSGSVTDWFLARARGLTPFITLTVLVIFFAMSSDRFLQADNLTNILRQISPLAIAATGLTFVVLCAEIDLSFANIAALSGIVLAAMHVAGHGTLAVPVALALAVVLGLISGFFTSRFSIPSFMVTLAMMQIAAGLTIKISKGKPYFPPAFTVPSFLRTLGTGEVFGVVPILPIVAGVVLLAGHLVLTYTRFGRYVYMTGGNREAAELAGVRTRRVVMSCLVLSAFTGAVAGLLLVGRIGSAQPSAAGDMLLNGIAAVVLGGTSLFGGEGGVKNTLVGLLIFGVLSNGLDLLPNVDVYTKGLIQGVILLSALIINVLALKLGNSRRATATD